MASRAEAAGLDQGVYGVFASRERHDPFRRLPDTTISADEVESGDDVSGWVDRLASAEQRLDYLMALPENWDGFGGVAVSEETRTRVFKLLDAVTSPRDVLPSLVPGTDGSVNLEWHRPDLFFEICVEPSGHVTAYFHDVKAGDEREMDYHSIEPRVGDLIARFIEP
jgi:hypothetical protein